MSALQFLLVIAAAWSIDDGAALPIEISPSSLIELGEMELAPSSAEAAAKAKVAAAQKVAQESGSKVSNPTVTPASSTTSSGGGTSSTASTSSTKTTTVSSSPAPPPSTDGNTQVPVPSPPSVSSIAKSKTIKEVSTGKFFNRNKKPGDEGWINQQAEVKQPTGQTAIDKIDSKLVQQRAAKYSEAKGATDVYKAATDAAHAAEDMASQVRKEDAKKVSKAAELVDRLQAKLDRLSGKTGRRGSKIEKRMAKLQLRIAKAKGRLDKREAKAASMGQAVNQLIAKAATIQGRAKERAVDDADGSTKLLQAQLAAAKAQLALKAFEKETKVTNAQKEDDKKMQQHVEKVNEDASKKVADAKEKYAADNSRASDTAHTEAKNQAADTAKKMKALADKSVSPSSTKPIKLTSLKQPLTKETPKTTTVAKVTPSPSPSPVAVATSDKDEAIAQAKHLTEVAKEAKSATATLEAVKAQNHAAALSKP